MNVRDSLNTEENYIETIQRKQNDIDKSKLKIKERLKDEKDGIQKYPKPNLEIIQSVKESFPDKFIEISYAKYSKGDSINEVSSIYVEMIPYLIDVWKKSNGYVQMVEILSIGIMLNIDDEHFNELAQCVKDDNPNDFLIDVLINYRNRNWGQQSEKFMWNKPYKLTQEIVELAKTDKEKALSSLKKYLTQWYKSIEIKTHKSKWNIHTGYWCWEAGALVKILGLDDSSLKDQQYYPYDMVHFKN
jgi:hypothetical protein